MRYNKIAAAMLLAGMSTVSIAEQTLVAQPPVSGKEPTMADIMKEVEADQLKEKQDEAKQQYYAEHPEAVPSIEKVLIKDVPANQLYPKVVVNGKAIAETEKPHLLAYNSDSPVKDDLAEDKAQTKILPLPANEQAADSASNTPFTSTVDPKAVDTKSDTAVVADVKKDEPTKVEAADPVEAKADLSKLTADTKPVAAVEAPKADATPVVAEVKVDAKPVEAVAPVVEKAADTKPADAVAPVVAVAAPTTDTATPAVEPAKAPEKTEDAKPVEPVVAAETKQITQPSTPVFESVKQDTAPVATEVKAAATADKPLVETAKTEEAKKAEPIVVETTKAPEPAPATEKAPEVQPIITATAKPVETTVPSTPATADFAATVAATPAVVEPVIAKPTEPTSAFSQAPDAKPEVKAEVAPVAAQPEVSNTAIIQATAQQAVNDQTSLKAKTSELISHPTTHEFNNHLVYTDSLAKDAQNGDAYSLEVLEYLGAKGNIKAEMKLGFMYENALGVPKDDKKAFSWYSYAANNGVTLAALNLSRMYTNGIGVVKDDKKAFDWANTAATEQVDEQDTTQLKGRVYALQVLSGMYAHGTGVSQNWKMSFDTALQAAMLELHQPKNKSDGSSFALMAQNYIEGKSTIRDHTQAFGWYLLAAGHGNMDAQMIVGQIYATGSEGVKDDKQALYWFTRAAQQGNPIAQQFVAAMTQGAPLSTAN